MIALGTHLAEVTSGGYTLFQSPLPKQTLVHVHADAGELGRVYQPALAINCGVREFARALAAMPAANVGWQVWTQSARADYEKHSGAAASDVPTEGVDMTQVLMHLNATPGRVASTGLSNPDFVTLATAFGAFAERVERNEDFPAAFVRAQASGSRR